MPLGSQVGKKDQRRPTSKFFLSQTGRGRALIFVSKHLCFNLYQVCLYHVLGGKTGPTPGVTSWNRGTKKTNFKILHSETGRLRALIFGYYVVSPLDLYQIYSYDARGQNWPQPRGHNLEQ